MTQDKSVDAVVIEILRDLSSDHARAQPLNDDTTLVGDLSIDSMGMIAFAARLEETLKVDVAPFLADLGDARTVADIKAFARRVATEQQ